MKKENEELTLDGLGINKEVVAQMKWDDLEDMFKSIATDVQKQQTLILELAKQHESMINKDINTFNVVSGLIKSIEDIANDIVGIHAQHCVDNTPKTGPVDSDDMDAVMLNIELASKYVTANEVLANVASTGFIDIFSKLKIDGVKELTEITNVGKEAKSKIDHRVKG